MSETFDQRIAKLEKAIALQSDHPDFDGRIYLNTHWRYGGRLVSCAPHRVLLLDSCYWMGKTRVMLKSIFARVEEWDKPSWTITRVSVDCKKLMTYIDTYRKAQTTEKERLACSSTT